MAVDLIYFDNEILRGEKANKSFLFSFTFFEYYIMEIPTFVLDTFGSMLLKLH